VSDPVKLIVGLGNPGQEYERTRHNAGFWFVEHLAKIHGSHFKPESKFQGEVARVSIGQHDVWLLKPSTFMNRSGQSVHKLANFYKIQLKEILVAHDELDFPAGKIRLKNGGGHGGHNGLRDIIGQFGGNNFMRLRIGIGHPGASHMVTGYVLGRAQTDDQILMDRSIEAAAKVVPLLLAGEEHKATQRLHTDSIA